MLRVKALAWQHLEIHDVAGEGHSGVVYRATLRVPFGTYPAGSLVAVKRYRPFILAEAGQISRVFREFEASRSIQHDNIVKVLGPVLDDVGRPALIMEYCEGPTLESWLAELPTGATLEAKAQLLRGVASAVYELHQYGIIHRDIKPANVIITAQGPVVTDLGVVRMEALPDQTTTGSFLGTIRYAAPEYLFGKIYDRTIDIYSVGAIAHELFLGRRVFHAQEQWAELVAAKMGMPTLSQDDLTRLSSEHGHNATEFIRTIIRSSVCGPEARDLELGALVQALDDTLWRRSFVMSSGRLLPGDKTFEYDVFKTAPYAAERLRASLSSDALGLLRRVVAQFYWSRGFRGSEIPAPDLPAFGSIMGAIRTVASSRHFGGGLEAGYYGLYDSVREAFALGLLQ
jgi:serine/threonine protein kinase